MSSPTTAVAEFRNVGKQYPNSGVGAWAVRNINLRIEPGEVFGLLGPNRAGKTTLAKLLLSLCRPSEGEILRFDRPVEVRRTLTRIGYVHEAPTFPRDLNAVGLLEYYGALSLVPSAELRWRIPALLERVGLADRVHEPIGGFSKGMIQRLGLAQALLNEPDLLVLDEPTEGLDLSGRQLVRDLVLEQRERGRAVLLISHALSDVEHLCDRVAVLVEGRKVYDGPLADLKGDPASGSSRPLEQALSDLYRRSAG
ncbi:ABC transporter ATP-binding protein [Singulisphaera acidiphila]|uniref:ABC-type multidrug transport system, ATPase component n=1 Tax=Singulisphaera acidiphila (strain ATCC BAA-1392 / DSM 18658 / VKM B-2454 / MOB10) TaxID=886293 RepID=L0DT34_SINAD|nr:ABC transporter ATP-binding protein [Singulisphaera acidiphila]AGA31526.1 ABC-type multidrug transport system, ATPase component [Singulisphaera acidiphila DSM 18658]